MKSFSITKHHAKSSKTFPARMIVEASTTTTPGAGGKSIRIFGFDHEDGHRRYSVDLSPDLLDLIVKVHTLNKADEESRS